MRLITLLTDFGLADTYVGQMKGALLAVAPHAMLVDLTHAVPPQDIDLGSFLLSSAVDVFPAGTVHLAVVDPGVGSGRRGLAIQAGRGDIFVGPDNGLLLPGVDRLGGVAAAIELTRPEFWRPVTSATFHGRDIFGPVAAHLAMGVPLERLGQPILDPRRLPSGPISDGRHGHVVQVDGYGNLVTSIPQSSLPERFQVHVNGHLAPGAAAYAAVPRGGLLALVGSTGLLEIAANCASAADLTGAARGTPVSVEAL